MKKFLTVLLALSVVFTYSFSAVGTAFAASVSNADANLIKQATEYAKAQLPATIEKAYKDVVAADKDAYITEDAWKAASGDIAKAFTDEYDADMDAYLTGAKALPGGWNAYPGDLSYIAKALYGNLTSWSSYQSLYTAFSNDTHNYTIMAAKKQFKINFEAIVGLYDKVDADTLYSKTTPTTGETYYEQAVKAINDSKAGLKDHFFDDNGDVQNVTANSVSDVKNIEDILRNNIVLGNDGKPYGASKLGVVYYDGTTVVQYYYIDGIPTKDDEAGDSATIAATTAAIKAQVAKNVAAFSKNNKSTSDKEFADDYAAFYNYLADNITKLDAAGAAKLASDVVAHEKNMVGVKGSHAAVFAKAVADAEELEAYAAKYAAEKDASGALVRDPVEVDKLVEKAKVADYASRVNIGVKNAYSISQAKTDIANMTTKGDAAKLVFDKEAEKADLDDEMNSLLDDYYDLEAAQVKAAYAAAKEKVDSAKAASEFQAIETALDKEVNKIKNATTVDALFATGKMNDELVAQTNSLTTLVNHKNANAASYDDSFILGQNQARTLLMNYYIENNARTVEEMKALTGAVEAVAATLPTNAQLAAAKKAADDAIAALPATAKITSADKDAFKNAYDLAEAYNKLVKTTTGTKGTLALPANKVSALQAAIQQDFNLAYAKADKTDKAALKAIAADVAAAEEELVDSGLMSNSFVDPTVNALAKIRAAEKQAVIDAIKAIPMNVTEADKAVVEKARALYDAYVAEYTDYDLGKDDNDAGYVVKEFENYYHDLALAEATLGLNADPAKDVEALKITASSTAKKGSITVKWTVKGDTSAVEGYEIWRSTKKNSGFSKFFTTTKTTYKNTKSLKKGTRYYYKVRAIAHVDGKKITSDWSNKAYRIAK